MFGSTANHIKGTAPTSALQGPKENRGRSQVELVSPFLQRYLQIRAVFPALAAAFD